MSFRDIRDQDVPVRLLTNMLRRNRIPNGLLFWGPSGVGKRLAAMETAKAVNCLEHAEDACDACLSCRKVNSGNHPDVRILAPVKKSRIISVETVESMNEFAALRSFESKWRVFIIHEADRMGGPAQNHFLKTLEEPPGDSLFILITEFPGMLLPTIRSRCQRVRFGTLRPQTVTELLRRERDLPQEVAEGVAGIAQGQMSRALDLVDSDKRAIALDLSRRLAQGEDPLAVAVEFAGHLKAKRTQVETAIKAELRSSGHAELTHEDKEDLKTQQMAVAEALIRQEIMEYLRLLGMWYRDQHVYRLTQDSALVLNRDQLDHLGGAQTKGSDFDSKLAALNKARQYLERFLNEERVFRDLFFELAR